MATVGGGRGEWFLRSINPFSSGVVMHSGPDESDLTFPELEGWGSKAGLLNPEFRRRFFALRGYTLTYRREPNGPQKGAISLCDFSLVPEAQQPRQLTLLTPERAYTLQFDDELDLRQWREALTRHPGHKIGVRPQKKKSGLGTAMLKSLRRTLGGRASSEEWPEAQLAPHLVSPSSSSSPSTMVEVPTAILKSHVVRMHEEEEEEGDHPPSVVEEPRK